MPLLSVSVSTAGFKLVNLSSHMSTLPLQGPTLDALQIDGDLQRYNLVECANSNATVLQQCEQLEVPIPENASDVALLPPQPEPEPEPEQPVVLRPSSSFCFCWSVLSTLLRWYQGGSGCPSLASSCG